MQSKPILVYVSLSVMYYQCILHKGHGKDKFSDRSYRTISTCPLLAKCLDIYIGELYGSGWAEQQADTQFQGPGSSHELAALLLTETIQYSMHVAKEPLFVIFLDAKSAFDKILRENIIRNAYLAGTNDQALLYIDNRLKHRQTFCEWDKVLMGPIKDKLGVEQGGVNSDKLYKLCNNTQLSTAQHSEQGVTMGPVKVSSIGQADDTGLLSNSIFRLNNLVHLTSEYCAQYQVELVPEKTHLLAYCPNGQENEVFFQKLVSPISIDGTRISFSDSAEHVGIVRSILGNMPAIFSRVSAHKKAVNSVLASGMAKNHYGNPAASLRVERLYGSSVLLSGLASLVLSKPEIAVVDQHFKEHLECLQRLHSSTPRCVVYFLGGTLPATALLHLKQFSLLGMIARLGKENILHCHGLHMLICAKSSSKSWFLQVRDLCLLYSLPHPIELLTNPLTKHSFKHLVKSRVTDYWENLLRGEASFSELPSLKYFQPSFMSLSSPHPLWSSAGSSQYEVRKATVQARMLSGRYRSDMLSRHWTRENPDGNCLLPSCLLDPTPGTLEHTLVECPGTEPARVRAVALWASYMKDKPYLLPIVSQYTVICPDMFVPFLLDCSTLPLVISEVQKLGKHVMDQLLYMCRTWCFSVHKVRMKSLGRWNYKH